MKRTNWMAAVVMGMALAAPAMAQNATQRLIVVSLEDRKLALVENGEVKKVYSVAVGKPSTPSPVGTFTIERRVVNPVYHHDGRTVQPGPNNPVGTRWMGLNIRGYGIHGTNAPSSIGKAASHGCIRMAKADLEDLYSMVEVGDTVELIGEHNDETARLFRGAPATPPTTSTQPLLSAHATPAGPSTFPAVIAEPTVSASGEALNAAAMNEGALNVAGNR